MWAFPPVALLFCAATGGFDVNGGVVSETRVGEAPLQTGGAPRAGFVAILTPGIEAQYLRRDFELHLAYGPRIFWRQPNELESLRPLVLHTATLGAVARASRTVRFTGNGSLAAGAADYTSLGLALGSMMTQGGTSNPTPGGGMAQTPPGPPTPSAALPSAMDVLSVSGELGGDVSVSRTWLLGLAARIVHRRPLGGTDGPMMPSPSIGSPPIGAPPILDPPTPTSTVPVFVIRQTTIGVAPFVLDHLSRLSDATLSIPASRTVFENGTSVLTISPQMELRTHLGRTWDLRASVGLAAARVSAVNAPTVQVGTATGRPEVTTPWGPVGGIEGNGVWLSRNETALRLTVGATAEQYVDPILQVAGPRGSAMTRLSLLLSPFWTCGVEAGFATSLSAKPLQFAMSTAVLDETVAYASLPIRYRASDEVVVEFGGRWLDRAPHLAAPDFAFHQRQLWFYVTIYATTRRQAPWRTP